MRVSTPSAVRSEKLGSRFAQRGVFSGQKLDDAGTVGCMGTTAIGLGVRRRGLQKTERPPSRSRPIGEISSEALLARTADRDDQAFAELYDRYGAPAFALAYRVLRDRDLAADAVQEGFLGLWRSAGQFRGEQGTPRTFLLTLVHRRAVDRVRREEHRKGEPLDERTEPTTDGDELGDSLERERVRAALCRLPGRCREAIELAYFDGLTQQEIALRLRVPLGTVKSRTAHGLRTLAELLREGDVEEKAAAQRQFGRRGRS